MTVVYIYFLFVVLRLSFCSVTLGSVLESVGGVDRLKLKETVATSQIIIAFIRRLYSNNTDTTIVAYKVERNLGAFLLHYNDRP